MRGGTLTDTQLLLDLVGEVYSFEDLPQFRTGVLEALDRVVPSDARSYNEIGPRESFEVTVPALDPALLPAFSELIHENPLITYTQRTRDGRPNRISDMVDAETFHSLALYKRFYKFVGVERQVAFTLPSPPSLIVGIALSREHEDFTDREVQLLALARPHLIQAYRNAQLWETRQAMLTALEEGLETLGRHVVVIDDRGRIEFATDGARRLLGETAMAELPGRIDAWLAVQPLPRAGSAPLPIRGAHGELLVRVLPSHRQDGRSVLLVESGTGTLSAEALQGLGLTRRQAEALRWLALGHSPSQAASRMGIAPRTAHKHLQHVYAKLNVHTIETAVATAWAAVGIERPR
jgi:DNA-binding CsgD family transcriptional regulator